MKHEQSSKLNYRNNKNKNKKNLTIETIQTSKEKKWLKHMLTLYLKGKK
jgi:hypothetical protein